MGELVFYSLVGGLFSLGGGILLLVHPHWAAQLITPLISFGAGAFLAAAFLDILPEALETAGGHGIVLPVVLVGFLAFFILERLIMRYFRALHPTHEHSEHTESLAFLLILSDAFHNFLDGIVLAVAYVANPVLGLPTALAIAAHEIPQEIGDFSVLLHLKWPKTKIVLVNVLQSLIIVPGVFLGYFLGQVIQPQLHLLLAATAGIFIYISASDLVPELHHHSGHRHFFRVVGPMIGSIVLIYFLITLTHL